jgi:hypothetical protein
VFPPVYLGEFELGVALGFGRRAKEFVLRDKRLLGWGEHLSGRSQGEPKGTTYKGAQATGLTLNC